MGLIPRDQGFFILFNQLAAKMKVAAELLQEMFATPDRLDHFVAEIKKNDPEAQALATGWMWKEGRKNEWACQ